MPTLIGGPEDGIPVFGKHDEGTLEQMADVGSRAVRSALMADGHKGYVMPIGGVAAYDNKVSVVGVGFDIACGNCAILTDLTIEQLSGGRIETAQEAQAHPHKVMDNPHINELATDIANIISFGIGRKNLADDAPVDDPLFHDEALSLIPNKGGYRDALIEKAREQLGTVGGGNHYVDVFYDDKGRIWVGVHFGSRGFGHTIASNFIALSQGLDWGERGKEQEILLDLRSILGWDYWALMEVAGRYAYAGREWVARKVVELMGGKEVDMVHNHHNFAWKETHEVDNELRELVVVRKGATPAFPGQRGFVGGSMGDDSVILMGTDPKAELEITYTTLPAYMMHEEQKAALYSTVHGAGRVMSRTEAKGKWTKKGVMKKRGKVSHYMVQDWLKRKGVVLKGGDLDESPHAYKRLNEVLTEQGDTITVLETLHPMVVCMAPRRTRGSYKD